MIGIHWQNVHQSDFGVEFRYISLQNVDLRSNVCKKHFQPWCSPRASGFLKQFIEALPEQNFDFRKKIRHFRVTKKNVTKFIEISPKYYNLSGTAHSLQWISLHFFFVTRKCPIFLTKSKFCSGSSIVNCFKNPPAPGRRLVWKYFLLTFEHKCFNL